MLRPRSASLARTPSTNRFERRRFDRKTRRSVFVQSQSHRIQSVHVFPRHSQEEHPPESSRPIYPRANWFNPGSNDTRRNLRIQSRPDRHAGLSQSRGIGRHLEVSGLRLPYGSMVESGCRGTSHRPGPSFREGKTYFYLSVGCPRHNRGTSSQSSAPKKGNLQENHRRNRQTDGLGRSLLLLEGINRAQGRLSCFNWKGSLSPCKCTRKKIARSNRIRIKKTRSSRPCRFCRSSCETDEQDEIPEAKANP